MFLLRAKYKQKKKANIDNMRTVTQLHIKKYASLDNSFSHIKINRNKFYFYFNIIKKKIIKT